MSGTYASSTGIAAGGQIIFCAPWKQYFDLGGAAPPKSTVRNITLPGIRGQGGSFAQLAGNPGQSTLTGITFENIDVTLTNPKLAVEPGAGVTFKHVVVNGAPYKS